MSHIHLKQIKKGLDLLNHINDKSSHITAEERDRWNSGTGGNIDTSSFVTKDGNVPLDSITVGSRLSNSAVGQNSSAQGTNVTASGDSSHAEGNYTTANTFISHVQGRYNNTLTGNATSYNGTADAFVIGNGSSSTALSNAFRVTFDGKVYGRSSYSASGADYAEYFEWKDGNVDGELRTGYVVTLDGTKIAKAKEGDYILGIISSTASMIGDAYEDNWAGMYERDEWENVLFHNVNVEYTSLDEEGNEVVEMVEEYQPKIVVAYNSEEEYIPRSQRNEWDVVGLMGKLLVRDDGTCKPNSFAKVGSVDGEITHSDEVTNMRVMERVSENVVRVFMK